MFQVFFIAILLGIFVSLVIVVVYLIKYYTLFRDTNENFSSVSRNFNNVSSEVEQIIREERERN